MKLSSVNALKEQLLGGPAASELSALLDEAMSASPATPLGATSFARAARGELRTDPLTARRMRPRGASSERRPRSDDVSTRVALGVAAGGGRGDYFLGARISDPNPSRARLVATRIKLEARGECDVALVPEVRRRAHPVSWFRSHQTGLECGLSVGHLHDVMAGSLGALVEDDRGVYLLSNNHVLADVNRNSVGDLIVQPGRLDLPGPRHTPQPDHIVAELTRFEPIYFSRANTIDAAIARLLDDVAYYPRWNDAIADVMAGVSKLEPQDLGMKVCKVGRTTGLTQGTITLVQLDGLEVDMGDPGSPRLARFYDQMEITAAQGAFSDQGDSGSLIVAEESKAAVGLLFAGGKDRQGRDRTFANRIELVLSRMGVRLAV